MTTQKRLLVLLAIVILFGYSVAKFRSFLQLRSGGPETVQRRLTQFAQPVAQRLLPDFQRVGVPYPPDRLVLAGFKQERMLELYSATKSGPLQFIRAYPIQAASGKLGPKLQDGDLQVPEGLYGIEYLNPNSSYHLSMKIDYPNAFDRMHGKLDGRAHLGGDIMIHGNAVSIGCLAIGDTAAEDLFVLAALTGIKNVTVILTPVDFRVHDLPSIPPDGKPLPSWTKDLYLQIRAALQNLPPH